MATLSLMPIWGFIYVRALTDGPTVVEGPLGEGVEVYSNCAELPRRPTAAVAWVTRSPVARC